MPGPRAVQNLQMPHPRDLLGGQTPCSSPGGGGAGRRWNWLMHYDKAFGVNVYSSLSMLISVQEFAFLWIVLKKWLFSVNVGIVLRCFLEVVLAYYWKSLGVVNLLWFVCKNCTSCMFSGYYGLWAKFNVDFDLCVSCAIRGESLQCMVEENNMMH